MEDLICKPFWWIKCKTNVFIPGLYIREQTTVQFSNLLKVKIDFYPLNHTRVIDSWDWKKLESLPTETRNICILYLTIQNGKLTTFRNSLFLLWREQIIRKFSSNLSSCSFHSFKLLNYFLCSSLELHMTFPHPIYLLPCSWLPSLDNPQFPFPSRSFPSNWCTLNIVSAKTPATARS